MRPAALASGVSAGAAPLINMAGGGKARQLAGRSLVGGLASSVAGGGKFANGATSAAFQYLLTASLASAHQASGSGGTDGTMNAMACMGCSEQYPFQQAAASQGFSGSGPDIIGGYGRALYAFFGSATLFLLLPNSPLRRLSFLGDIPHTPKWLTQLAPKPSTWEPKAG